MGLSVRHTSEKEKRGAMPGVFARDELAEVVDALDDGDDQVQIGYGLWLANEGSMGVVACKDRGFLL